tara:strand:- start:139 stop:579 length:441 start_codon:yes stop_codon:yes gene_type:complete
MVSLKHKKKHINKRLKSLLEISHIRFQKILEMSQEGVIAVIFSLILATIFNKFSFDLNVSEDVKIVFLKICIEIILLIVLFYYLRKVLYIFPFLFHYTKEYIPSRPSSDGEGLIGKTVSIAIVFGTLLEKLKKKIKYFSSTIVKII